METGETIETIKVFNYAKYNERFKEQLEQAVNIHRNQEECYLNKFKTCKGLLNVHTKQDNTMTMIFFEDERSLGVQPVYYYFEDPPQEEA